MKNQMYTLGRVGIRALGFLAIMVGISACTDDYTLDDEKPAWLGESVYDKLQNDGNFTNYLRLMDDLDMKKVLSRTGSRTVFAANDDAFNAFYAYNATLPVLNPWHTATSYDKLTKSQKALLAKSTMLNNAITMETLSTSPGTKPERGKYLRQATLVTVADTVTKMRAEDLPYSYNTMDFDFWQNFRNDKGILLTDGDGTSNMMLCFTAEQMAKNSVNDDDFALVMGVERNPTDVYVYDSKVIEQDVTCQNGYIDVVDRVIRPLPNMAEVIRTNGKTNIFSHILDRFSAPVYVEELNTKYRDAHPDFPLEDTIYTKWYFSDAGTSSIVGPGKPVYLLPNGGSYHITQGTNSSVEVASTYKLKFDPAWNACKLVAGVDAEEDMAAIFVPSDETLLEAFQRGRLRTLVDEYATPIDPALVDGAMTATIDNLEPLYKAIDWIKLDILAAMVNNLMRDSYNGSVKSKFSSLKGTGSESLFGTGGCIVDKVELACNGAIYITKSFHAPSDYSSVASPAFIQADKRVMKFAIYDGNKDQGWNDIMRGLNYYAYLRAMASRFTLFLPDDEAMQYVYTPMSFVSEYPYLLSFEYNKDYDEPTKATGDNAMLYKAWKYDIANGQKKEGEDYLRNLKLDQKDLGGVLTDVLQLHTLVHNSEADLISQNRTGIRDQYFVTKGNDAIKVTYDMAADTVLYIQGGFQIENEQAGFTQPNDNDEFNRGTVRCHVKRAINYQEGTNGDTYIIDAPAVPAVKSVWKVLSEHEQFSSFLDLCMGHYDDDDIMESCGFFEDLDFNQKENLKQTSYTIFFEKNSTLDYITTFFNQYNYTVFVPSNDAIEEARQEGFLYNWDDIVEDFDACKVDNPDYDGNSIRKKYLLSSEDSIRIRSKVTYLFNFVRLHFMDNAVFADNTAWNNNDNIHMQNYATSCFYQISALQGNFMKLHVKRLGNGRMTVQGLNNDMNALCGYEADVMTNVVDTDNDAGYPVPLHNMMAREFTVVNNANREADIHVNTVTKMNDKRVANTSSAVVHLINHALRYTDTPLDLDKPENARRYLMYNRVVNKEHHD